MKGNERTQLHVDKDLVTKTTHLDYGVRETYFYTVMDHPYIIKPTDIFVNEGSMKVTFVMPKYQPYLKNSTMVVMDMLKALSYLEMKKIIHNDLKLNNILYNQTKGHHVLIDFGNATFVDHCDSAMGTYYISSPEILVSNLKKKEKALLSPSFLNFLSTKKASNKSDMWSLGCILYEIIMKKPLIFEKNAYPINAFDALKIVQKLFWEREFIFPSTIPDICKRCLQLNPDKRPSASQELEIEHFLLTPCCTPTEEISKEYDSLFVFMSKIMRLPSNFIVNKAIKLVENYLKNREPMDFDEKLIISVSAFWLVYIIIEGDVETNFYYQRLDMERFCSLQKFQKTIIAILKDCNYNIID
jgi:serine/threonine protein kinase